ncbi:hypothetical protein E2C01_070299 [Portunus trituberculatus]|uniref:Uncharacterized protein n=1 Tax=Portunus trituberculatus TaxID=210409 RepID=A0A5B7HTU5_PORTR|nr:hypothetical protein [Portunus trituberculatus]
MKVVVVVAVIGALLAFSKTAEGANKGPKVTHKVIFLLFLIHWGSQGGIGTRHASVEVVSPIWGY